ncbi:alkaline phosphatase [Pendulispora brunnea]|uniref:Alkaline phosphatase n=1 Tax=Pendulispora brunnea TaxID=2905690 RepID=A0ABZ2KMG7_9BACT
MRRGFFLAVATAVCAACAPASKIAPATPQAAFPKNVIVLFADGTASTQWEFGRYTSEHLRKRPFLVTDVVFRQGTLGLMSTCSATGMVTDSAAAATAMSTGEKTHNFMLSIAPDGKPLPTMMETAKAAGLRTGLVTTTAIYDASPAGFSVHANDRRAFQTIVDQYRAFEPDVLMGGGADYFLPSPVGKRNDGEDVIAAFTAKGYRVVQNANDLADLRVSSPPGGTPARLLGLFPESPQSFVDRPTVAERERAALSVLSRDERGFLLFVENESTDNAGHANDIAGLMHALWDFDDAVAVALDFQKQHPDTLVIVTGDHETGGLSVTTARAARSNARIVPGETELRLIDRISLSLEVAADKIASAPVTSAASAAETLDQLLAMHFPGFILDAELRRTILEAGQLGDAGEGRRPDGRDRRDAVATALARMVSRQTGFYWGTSGHTTEPVVVGAIGPGAGIFRGYQDNTEFARHLRSLITRRSVR